MNNTVLKIFPKTEWFRRTKHFLSYYLSGLYHRINEDHVFLFGGGLTFAFFACTVPFILIIFSVLGKILEVASIERQIDNFIDNLIPYEDYAIFVKKIIFTRIEEVITYKKLAGYLGAVGLLFAASGLFGSMRTILNMVYRVTENKHVVIGKLIDFGMVILVVFFFLISTIILPALEIAKASVDKIDFLQFYRISTVQKSLISSISFLLILLAFYILYYFIPYGKVSKSVTGVSALSAAMLWEIARLVFGYYITNFASLGRIYGTYVFIVVVAFWIYYSSVVFIVGAEIGDLYKERHMKLGR